MNFFWKSKKEGPDWSFQSTAVANVVRDFEKNQQSRSLLVIPTGGGKTLTAIRAINEMYDNRLLSEEDKVLWVVHTLSLRTNAKSALESTYNQEKFSLNPKITEWVDVCMKTEAIRRLQTNKNYRIIVIDEAHHSAADTYREFFEYPVGILGLTATPTRMDRKDLPFDKISYSITFRELVRRGVVLLPKFLPEVQTNLHIDISSLEDEEQLERFNSQERNDIVSDHIFREAGKHELKKIIVFAGTNAHVKRLFEVIKKRNDSSSVPFGHIGYIYGGDSNERGITNEEYLKWHHNESSSVLVNCRILNEGYDDPAIDTVVMATLTNSILYYLQCIGRVVRTPKDYKNARAYVIEIVDKLPNISYRIDNRWLFSEISDFLEPTIEDTRLKWPFRVPLMLLKLFVHNARLRDVVSADWMFFLLGGRINFLLFNDLPDNQRGRWRIMSMRENDLSIVQMFNDLSENIEEYYPLNHDYLLEQKYPNLLNRYPLDTRTYRSSFFASLRRASLRKREKEKVDSLVYLSAQ